jgi:hypothetical protein
MAFNWNDPQQMADWFDDSTSGIGVTPAARTAQAASQGLQTTPQTYNQNNMKRNRQTVATENSGGATTIGTGGSQGVANSSQYGMPWGSSSEWFGGLDEYGGLTAAANPGLMFDLYAQNALGLQPGSQTAQFMGQNYNPYAMGTALGLDPTSPDERLASGTWMANQIGQPGMTFFDPGTIVTQALQQLASGSMQGPGAEYNQLSAILQGTPDQQLNNLINFLGEALKGSMTEDVLQSYLGWLHQQGQYIVAQVMNSKAQGGGLAEFEKGKGNIATHLLNMIGASGGL